MKRTKYLLLLASIFLLSYSVLSAEEKKEGFVKKILKMSGELIEKAKDAPLGKRITKPVPKDMTKDELLEQIKMRLEHEREIADFIPGLKLEKDAKGNIRYKYQGVELADLDSQTLNKLFSRVQNEATRIRTERLNRQLESIRQAEQAGRAAQAASRAAVVVTPPPRPPQTPPTPPSTPQTPQPPPAPPQPTRR